PSCAASRNSAKSCTRRRSSGARRPVTGRRGARGCTGRMRPMPLRTSALLAAAALLGLAAASADAAESYARILNGEKFQGDVPADSDMRLEFDVARGAEPRLTFSMTYTGPTVTFRETHLYGPDGQEVF